MSSRFLVRGEQTKFEIILRSGDFSEVVAMPKLPVDWPQVARQGGLPDQG